MTRGSLKKFAVVDLEATGASSMASIIQIGIVIIENDKIVNTYTTDINPHEKLSDHIKQLTGITDQQLENAPEFSQVASEIYHLLEDCIFVAHNVKFDANLLAEFLFLEGFELRTPRIDTVELSQIFFPNLEKYNLSYLSDLLDLALADAHTAIADALATARLFLKLKAKIEVLPSITLEKLLEFKDSLLFESSLIIEQAFLNSVEDISHDYNDVSGILLKKIQDDAYPKQVSESFEINLALLGLDARDKQLVFAKQVKETFKDSRASFIEADTGIGKTYGYILPLLAQPIKQQILISVPTKLLQNQMMEQELTKIRSVFGTRCHSLKGPSNYISLEKFYQSLQINDSNRLVNRLKMQILVWLLETDTGDLDEVGQKQRFEPYFESIRHDGTENLKSIFRDVDFWKINCDKVKSAQVLVTNHAYFIERVQDDKNFAKDKILVFDEAQKLLLTLDDFSRFNCNLLHCLKSIQDKLKSCENLLLKRLYESLQFDLSQWSSMITEKAYYLTDKEVERFHQVIKEIQSQDDFSLFPNFTDVYHDLWLEEVDEDQQKVIYLRGALCDFINFNHFLPQVKKSYFISATLQISETVFLSDLLGFHDSLYLKNVSPKLSQQKIWIDSQMPTITQVDEITYTRELVLRLQVLMESNEQILVLVTSKKSLNMISEMLDQINIKHLAQGKHGTAFALKKRFENKEAQLLLGMGTFWEGIDFSKDNRLIEVITRLPFDNPQASFSRKMENYMKQRGYNPFYDYSIPMMILRLKQAFGRVCRNENQRSAIVILDRRILTQSYGKFIVDYLSKYYPIEREKLSNYLAEIINFLV